MSFAPRIRDFYARYLPVGDRLGETFYAVWMVVVSLGILGATEMDQTSIAYVILVAFAVNITWGLIDGISVMQSNVIDRARTEQSIHDLRINDNEITRKAALDTLNDAVVDCLGEHDRRKVIDIIAAGDPGENPSKKRYYAKKDDWDYAIGIFLIDTVMVIPLIVPLLFISDRALAIYLSQLIATALFAVIGYAYAKNLHRREWLAALWLGTMGFVLFSWVFLWGW